ncbi:hypothetical protein [Novosphingobium guangzhouense]|uniref:Uncharacterized protein n=1 Tax=Novosphingobium guangzhouense TaxID=1850347 RepID=A0A2K2FZR2_9SPHN|nr:hypothetical protein [Novosphingobium guangzhouense]PNU04234.1 hypothetical protein A8V01_21570 [Novosphingobium guangzhouense]
MLGLEHARVVICAAELPEQWFASKGAAGFAAQGIAQTARMRNNAARFQSTLAQAWGHVMRNSSSIELYD